MAELRGVSKTYGSGGSAVLAVDGVDLSVRRGLLAVLGPNGAGKTTALGMLTGRRPPPAGPRGCSGGIRGTWGAAADSVMQSSGVPDTLRVRELLTASVALTTPPRCRRRWWRRRAARDWRTGCSGPCPGPAAAGAVRDRIVWGPSWCSWTSRPPAWMPSAAHAVGHAAQPGRHGPWRGPDHALPGGGRRAGRPHRAAARGSGDRRGHPVADQVPRPGGGSPPSPASRQQASGWAGVHHAQRDGTRLELLVKAEPVLRELLRTGPER